MSLYFQYRTDKIERNKRFSDYDPLNALWTGVTPDTKLTIRFYKEAVGYWKGTVVIERQNEKPLTVKYTDISIFINDKEISMFYNPSVLEKMGDFEVTMKKAMLQTKEQSFDFNQRVYTFMPTSEIPRTVTEYDYDAKGDTGAVGTPGVAGATTGGKRKSIRSIKRNITRRRNRNKNKNGGSHKNRTTRNKRK